MGTILTISAVSAIAGFIIGVISIKKSKIVEVSDFINPVKEKRTEMMRKQDAVMKLKNEIAASGAIHFDILEDGTERISLKLVI